MDLYVYLNFSIHLSIYIYLNFSLHLSIYICLSKLLYSSTDVHLGCFHVLTIVNDVATNIKVQILFELVLF